MDACPPKKKEGRSLKIVLILKINCFLSLQISNKLLTTVSTYVNHKSIKKNTLLCYNQEVGSKSKQILIKSGKKMYQMGPQIKNLKKVMHKKQLLYSFLSQFLKSHRFYHFSQSTSNYKLLQDILTLRNLTHSNEHLDEREVNHKFVA